MKHFRKKMSCDLLTADRLVLEALKGLGFAVTCRLELYQFADNTRPSGILVCAYFPKKNLLDHCSDVRGNAFNRCTVLLDEIEPGKVSADFLKPHGCGCLVEPSLHALIGSLDRLTSDIPRLSGAARAA